MSVKDLKPGELPPEIPDFEMHGPIEVAMLLYVMAPGSDGMKPKVQRVIFEAGRYPTRGALQQEATDMLEQGIEDGDLPEGSRLMTKPEFWEHIVKRETKMEQVQFPKDHDPNFVDPTADQAEAEAPAIITDPNAKLH